MTIGGNNQRLEDLSAEVLTRGSILTAEQITGFRISIARMEGKLDAALALREDFEEFEKETQTTLEDIKLKLGKLESFKAVALWVAGVVGMILAGSIGTIFSFILNRGP